MARRHRSNGLLVGLTLGLVGAACSVGGDDQGGAGNRDTGQRAAGER